ncbi:MAG TPA: DUF5060 domain-containing protein [Bacteroidales bacterium]|nr:DUF5060 domain-containing protein [Bacteroidales bacterium]
MKKIDKSVLIALLLLAGPALTRISPALSQDNRRREPVHEVVNIVSDKPLQISGLVSNGSRTGLFEKYEVTFNLDGKWDNPFDPDQVRVDAYLTAPDGKQLVIPGFFYQDYLLNAGGRPVKTGDPVWKIRFTPVMTGEYKYEIVAKNQGNEVRSGQQSFTCISYNGSHGFLGVSKTNPLYLEFSDGTPFFGVGQDRSQGESRGCYQRFANNGGNFNRLFLTNGNFNIEELNTPQMGADLGIGKMNQETSWNLDKVLELGEKLGIYHMLTITNQWAFNQMWQVHAYNKANGGMLASKNEYWTNEEAMKSFERRVRYHVARWGYSTAVFSWDLWNEYTAMGAPLEDGLKWHIRMSHYMKAIDPFDHVVHTNDGSFNGRAEMNGMPEMQVISTNAYGINDIAYLADVWTKKMINDYKKPYILTEYAMWHNAGQAGGYAGMDPERRMVHDGLWSPLMSGAAATGMAWEGNWLDHEIFYTFINAVHKIVDGVPFSKRTWKPVEVSSFVFAEKRSPYYADVLFEGWPGNFARPKGVNPEFFVVNREGRVEQQECLNAVLTGKSERPNASNTNSVTYKTDLPVNGEFIVYVTQLWTPEPAPQLTITVDGKEMLKQDLAALKTANYNPIMYNQHYPVALPKGPHTIQVANTGGGSFVTAYGLKNYLLKNGPDIEVRGLQTDDYMLLWLKNPKYTVLHELMKIRFDQQPAGRLELKNVPDGSWTAEWVNTIDAKPVRTELVRSVKNSLVLRTPAIGESVAVRLHKVN